MANSSEQGLAGEGKSIPTPTLADVLDQVSNASAAQVDSFLSFSNGISAERLYLQCVQTGTTGAWFTRQDHKVKMATRGFKYQCKFVQIATELVQDAVNSLRGAIMTDVPKAEQGARMRDLINMEEGLKREIRVSTTVKDLLMADVKDQDSTELAKFERLYETLVKKLAGMHDIIIKGVQEY